MTLHASLDDSSDNAGQVLADLLPDNPAHAGLDPVFAGMLPVDVASALACLLPKSATSSPCGSVCTTDTRMENLAPILALSSRPGARDPSVTLGELTRRQDRLQSLDSL